MARRGAAPSAVGVATWSGPLAAFGLCGCRYVAILSGLHEMCVEMLRWCSRIDSSASQRLFTAGSLSALQRRTLAAAIRARHSPEARRCNIRTGTARTHATSATGLGALVPCHICTGIGLTPVRARPSHIFTGTAVHPTRMRPFALVRVRDGGLVLAGDDVQQRRATCFVPPSANPYRVPCEYSTALTTAYCEYCEQPQQSTAQHRCAAHCGQTTCGAECSAPCEYPEYPM
jgi:hypothetical protein